MKSSNTKWPLIALAVAICWAFSGCTQRKYGPELTESAEIYDTCFVPKGHGSDVAIGMTTKGSMTVTPIDINIPARFAVVFKCQHGKFVIDGQRGEALYERFSKGDKVTVKYCDVIEITKDGERAVDLHFIDAVARND